MVILKYFIKVLINTNNFILIKLKVKHFKQNSNAKV